MCYAKVRRVFAADGEKVRRFFAVDSEKVRRVFAGVVVYIVENV